VIKIGDYYADSSNRIYLVTAVIADYGPGSYITTLRALDYKTNYDGSNWSVGNIQNNPEWKRIPDYERVLYLQEEINDWLK